MNLSPELIDHIGYVLAEQRARAQRARYTSPLYYDHACRMQLEWTQAIEAALREDEQREIDANAEPSWLLRKQAD